MENICVLMSTYNGEKYLEQQIDSILNQKEVLISLIIRDDGSLDSTGAILQKYAKLPNVTVIYGDNVGACNSFLKLISLNLNYDYYALADQDDVWDKDKLSIACKKLSEYNKKPALYYSNLRIVNQNNIFCRNAHQKPHVSKRKYSCLSESLSTGCTMVYNKKLAELLQGRMPTGVSMHDAWIYLVCGLLGELVYDFEPHINYRQHGTNVIGVSKKLISFSSIKREMKYLFNWKSQPRFSNAKVFYDIFGDYVDELTKMEIQKVVTYKQNLMHTLKLLLDRKLNSSSFRRKLRFKIKIILHNI